MPRKVKDFFSFCTCSMSGSSKVYKQSKGQPESPELNELSELLHQTAKDKIPSLEELFELLPAFKLVHELEKNLAIPKGFFLNLVKEDDWSFVIKLHSLIEAAVTHLLVEALSSPQLRDTFARLELSNFSTGKIAFADKLGLLDKNVSI